MNRRIRDLIQRQQSGDRATLSGIDLTNGSKIGDGMGRRVYGFRAGLTRAIAMSGLALAVGIGSAIAQSGDLRAQDQSSQPQQQQQSKQGAPGQTPADVAREQRKTDEFVEAQQAINGPAGNPECVWLGRRVVVLMWRDDLDTAFRHLDLYDRFGCPGGHVQATFRCLVKFGPIDPKVPDALSGRVHTCWINPNAQPQTAANQGSAPAPAGGQPAQAPAQGANGVPPSPMGAPGGPPK